MGKKTGIWAAGVLVLLAASFPASAEDEPGSSLSWNASLVSDYLFRGVSQTNEKPTAQATLTWTAPAGFYAGTFLSGVDFGPGSPHTEADLFVGYGHSLGDKVALDVLLSHYNYPGGSDLAYNELVTTATIDERWKLVLGYSNDIWNTGTTAMYYGAGAEWPLPKDFSLSANIGRTAFNDNLAVGAEDYTDWNVSVSKTIGIADVALGYYGTDGAGRRSFGNLADNRLLLTVSFGSH
ncbi:TorF family putative porin [Thermomonas sp.]|uniref:TorF family putative porin n=1 Tax=Thermomonas sp. TaxID=1971895 RepID=UPI0035B3BA4D